MYNAFFSKPEHICKARVDLPTPGFPPRRISEPDNRPPPRTLSTSFNPVLNLSPGSLSRISFKDLDSLSGRVLLPLALILNSDRVPHSLQEGHCPFHLGKSSPHAEHRKAVFVLAMMGIEIVHQVVMNQEGFTNRGQGKSTIAVLNNHYHSCPRPFQFLIKNILS